MSRYACSKRSDPKDVSSLTLAGSRRTRRFALLRKPFGLFYEQAISLRSVALHPVVPLGENQMREFRWQPCEVKLLYLRYTLHSRFRPFDDGATPPALIRYPMCGTALGCHLMVCL